VALDLDRPQSNMRNTLGRSGLEGPVNLGKVRKSDRSQSASELWQGRVLQVLGYRVLDSSCSDAGLLEVGAAVNQKQIAAADLATFRLMFEAEDIFTHFSDSAKPIPSLAELTSKAKDLNMRYSSMKAYQKVMHDKNTREYVHGPVWEPPVHHPSRAAGNAHSVDPADKQGKAKSSRKAKKATQSDPAVKFDGDRCLAQAISFMVDAINNLEMVSAVADCDSGRAWEATKVSFSS
jgi:hypothetical protein